MLTYTRTFAKKPVLKDSLLPRAQYIATTIRLDLFVAGKEAERTMEGLKEVERDLEAIRGELSEAAIALEKAPQLRLFA